MHGEEGTIRRKDIEDLAIKTLDSNIFDLTDNLGKKNIQKSLEILNELLYLKEPMQKILITLYNHFKKDGNNEKIYINCSNNDLRKYSLGSKCSNV